MIRLAVLRWLRDRLGDLAMHLGWCVEKIERVERDAKRGAS